MLKFAIDHYDALWVISHGILAAGVALLAIGLVLRARRRRMALPLKVAGAAIGPVTPAADWSGGRARR
jgi:hypothetical protein